MADTKISGLTLAGSVGANDLVPIVQNGTNLAARASMFGSGGSSSTSTILKPESYGAKGDGFLLTDLVVNSGSKTITSATAPFVSTAADAGKLVAWRVGQGSVEFGTIATVQSTTSATLVNNASASSNVNGGPNGAAMIGTDNTTALNATFAAATGPGSAASAFRKPYTPGYEVHFGRGVYVSRPLNVMAGGNVNVTGEGPYITYIATGDDTPLFQLDTYNSSASYAYPSNVLNWSFRNIQFINPMHTNGDSNGVRKGIAIQDNGNGNVLIENCWFKGLRYGFAAPYGSDFTRISGSYFYLCDVGSYFGPGSQQVEIGNCDYSLCREGLVFEGVQNWHVGSNSHFQDCTVSQVTIAGPSSGTTRMGISPTIGGGAWYSGMMVIDGSTWFESNSGNNGTALPRHIWINGDGPYGVGVEGITIRDIILVAGGTQVNGGTNTFVELNTNYVVNEPVIMDNIKVGGNFINSLFRASGNASNVKPTIIRCQVPSGVALTTGTNAARIINTDGTFHGFTAY